MNLNNKYFKPLSSSINSDIDVSTVFHYRQNDDIVWATYSGNNIRFGTLVGSFINNEKFKFNYQQIDNENNVKTGKCISDISVLKDGKLKIIENWEWTCGDFTKGKSSLIQVKN
jgi:hypothetical protein